MADKLEFQGLAGVLAHFDKSGEEARNAIKTYRSQVKELTGHDPSSPITPLDVVKIVQRVFFGGANDTARGISSDPGPAPVGDGGPSRDLAPSVGDTAQAEGSDGELRGDGSSPDFPDGDGPAAA